VVNSYAIGPIPPNSFEMPQYSCAELNCGVSRLSHSRLFVSEMGKAVGSNIAEGKKKFEAWRNKDSGAWGLK
jgi:hypothetical protein